MLISWQHLLFILKLLNKKEKNEMKVNNLFFKMIFITLIIGTVFFTGTYLAKNILEKDVITKKAEEPESMEAYIARREKMSVREFNETTWDKGKEIVSDFEKKFGSKASELTDKELSNEQYEYLNALYHLHEKGNNDILKRNESQAEFMEDMSLESSMAEIMAISPDKNTEKIIENICSKGDVNPDGKVKELSPEMIMEIQEKLFEYEQKNNLHEDE